MVTVNVSGQGFSFFISFFVSWFKGSSAGSESPSVRKPHGSSLVLFLIFIVLELIILDTCLTTNDCEFTSWTILADLNVTIQPSTPLSSSEIDETVSDVYRRHMGLKKKGRHALWTPQPYLQLPLKYRRGGTQVGDVGIITQEGAFDFMFNICGTIAQDPGELGSLPVGIISIHPPVMREKEVAILAEHHPGDAVTRGVSRCLL